MPTSGYSGFLAGEIVESYQYLFPRAIRAVGAIYRPGTHRRLIFVFQGTAPPHPPVAGRRAVPGGQVPVFGRVPLGGDFREAAPQIILFGNDHFPGTNRASRASDPGRNGGTPGVSLITPPPYFFGRPGRQGGRGEDAVLFHIPLRRQLRVSGGEVVFTGQNEAVGAVRTPRPPGPAFDHGLPGVALPALPPDPPLTAIADCFWG